ncbi:translation initiation factor eIF-2B subunit beta [Caerostris darwini]|uniref:Translation initiation factor eIF2B subunit beta n=1 Tax=Caerostris darwini TaxID=1538125 RepID=A0AAV4W5Q3_9ARAC|nr:translation initiation factor eIF-2B subunit beta [Caerostris darwini]
MSEQENIPEEEQVQFDVNKNAEVFLQSLKKRNIKYSSDIASETIKLLEKIVTNSDWKAAKDLMQIIRNIGKVLIKPHYVHTIVGNMVKRVLKIIRDEYTIALYGKSEYYDIEDSLQKMLITQQEEMDFNKEISSLKKSISANLRELQEECQRSPEVIAMQSEEHIHSDEIIMTFGYSRTVEKFLKAASKRNCEVVVVQGGPRSGGLELAKSLVESGISTTLIQTAAIFPVMSRVNKVIVGAHCIMANGGMKAICGVHQLALAAEYHSVPFYVLAPLFKVTPQFVSSSDEEGFNHMLSPEDLISFEDDELLRGVEIINPAYDYVPPENISLIIFNTGANSPSYVCRPLKELYHTDDHDL